MGLATGKKLLRWNAHIMQNQQRGLRPGDRYCKLKSYCYVNLSFY